MSGDHRSGAMEGQGEQHGRKSRWKDEKTDRSKDSLERKVRELQHRLDEEKQASRREKLSLARLQREMARQKSELPLREGVAAELEREKMLRVDSEQRLRDMTIENDSCKGRLRALQEEFKKMEEVVQNMMQYKTKIDQLKQEKSSLAVTYESNLQKYRSQMNCLERENMMLLNEVKKKESQTGCMSDSRDKTKLLLERLRIIETENSSLVLENEQQRQQYEKCLDEIANQVVQALLGQKTLREECLKLQGRVQDLELQNQQLNLMFQHKMQFSSEPLLQNYDDCARPKNPKSSPSWLKDQLGLAGIPSDALDGGDFRKDAAMTTSDPSFLRHSNGHIASPGSVEKRFRMKIETEFPASSNSSPKMKHVGIVACGPSEQNCLSANHSRASSVSALSLSNQNLSSSPLLTESDSLCVRKLSREEGVKSPGWEWVSPTGSRHDNQPFLSPIDDCSDDDESVQMTHDFSSASTMSLNEILDDRVGMEVAESEMEETHAGSSIENLSIPAVSEASIFFAMKPGQNSLSGIASLVQTSSPDSDSGVHTPCITSPVRSEDKSGSSGSSGPSGPQITLASTSTPFRASVSIPTPMQTHGSSTPPERPQSLELRRNGSTSASCKSNAHSRSIIPKRIETKSSSLPLAKTKTDSSVTSKSFKFKTDQSHPSSLKYATSSTNQTDSTSSGNSKYGARPPVSKSGKVSALPRKISNHSSRRTPDLLPPNITSTPSTSSKRNYQKLPDRNRTVVIASAMTDPNHISKAFEYCATNSTYVPGIDTPTVPRETVLVEPFCGNSCISFVYKHPSISSDSSSESIRVERSGSKDDGYSTMSSDVHQEASEKYADGTVKRGGLLKQDSLEITSVSPCFTDDTTSPSPVFIKQPPKPPPKPSKMPVALKSNKKKTTPPQPPPKPTSPRKPSKLPLFRSSSVSAEAKTTPKESTVVQTPSPTTSRVRQMAKMFEANASSVERPPCKSNRYSFHGDFNYLSKNMAQNEPKKNFRHSYNGSITMTTSNLNEDLSTVNSGATQNPLPVLTKDLALVAKSNDHSNLSVDEDLKSSHRTLENSAKRSSEDLHERETTVPNSFEQSKENNNFSVEKQTSVLGSAKSTDNEVTQSHFADSVLTDISSKDLLCAALAEEFSSPDSISPISDGSEDSLTQMKMVESDSVENYLMYGGLDSQLSDVQSPDVQIEGRTRDCRILHDITEESDASQSSAADNYIRRKMGARVKSAQRKMQHSVKKADEHVRPVKLRMLKSLSDSDLHKKQRITNSWLGRHEPQVTNISAGGGNERSASLGDITLPCTPLSSMSLSLRRSPRQVLIDEDTLSQKAAMLLHREHFSDDVYNYSSDSESDFEETINFIALWQQRPKGRNSLPEWNPKQTLAEATKGGLNFTKDLKNLKSSKDVDEWLLQFSDKDIDSHLCETNDSNFILLKSNDRTFENNFDEGSCEASAAQCEDVAMATEEDSEGDIDAQTSFRREFYSLCRVGSNKSLCSGSGIMGSDLDLGALNSGNAVVGTPLENCVQDLCTNPSLATGTSNEKMAEFDKISQQIASLSQTVDDLNRSLSSLDSVGGSSGDLRLDDFQPSNKEESTDGFHWVEDDEFYLEPCSGEVMVRDVALLHTDDGSYSSDWMNEYAKSSYQEQDEDFHNHLQDLSEESFLPQHHSAQRRHHGNHVISPEEMIARDAETRASLLDTMMDFGGSTSSLSSSADSPSQIHFLKNSPVKHGAKHFPKDRRRKGKLEVMRPICIRQRPTIDFSTFFTRYEEPEKRAVSSFDFLDNISTSSSEEDQGSGNCVRELGDEHSEGAIIFRTGIDVQNGSTQAVYQSLCCTNTPEFFSGGGTSSSKRKFRESRKRTQTPKVLKQAANLTKRLSNSSLDAQETHCTESLNFSDSCCERYSPSSFHANGFSAS
ncbi:uncharacterized protein LOC135464511 [Liolophura sinensis]|uniref:uncharacterized protein LOC135464511 n=1 Tax=Liolophura sinensis TaxID=3198878 RepID=UPI003158BF86